MCKTKLGHCMHVLSGGNLPLDIQRSLHCQLGWWDDFDAILVVSEGGSFSVVSGGFVGQVRGGTA